MNKLLASAALFLAMTASAYASPCTVVKTVGNIQFLNGSSDAQCNDGDDLKLFIDGVTNANSAGGSLGGNNNSAADSNITITSTGSGFVASTDGNGFANFKSVVDNVDAYEATGNAGTILPKTGTPGTTFLGFDGSLFRGQLTNNPNTPTVTWNGDVTILVDLSNGTSVSYTYTGFSTNTDIGVIGFDEVTDPGVFVTNYFAIAGDLTTSGAINPVGLGSWDEFKQIEMSVPGAVAAIPETSTWAMLAIGFGLMALGVAKRRNKARTWGFDALQLREGDPLPPVNRIV